MVLILGMEQVKVWHSNGLSVIEKLEITLDSLVLSATLKFRVDNLAECTYGVALPDLGWAR